MIKVNWYCPECYTKNSNDADEIENYAQFYKECGKEFYIDTDELFVVATDIKAVEN